MTALLYRLGGFCVRRRVPVLCAWLIAAAALGVLASSLGGTRISNNVTLPGTGSQAAADVLGHGFGGLAANGTNPLVLEAPAGTTLTEPRARAAVTRVLAAYEHDPAVLAAVGPLGPSGAAQLSRDARTGYISLTLRDGPAKLTLDGARRLFALSAPASSAGIRVAAGGYLGQALSQPSSASSEAIGLLAAVVVLLLTFGTVVAMGMPILTAVLGLGTALSLIALLSRVTEVPATAPALATMIGLGVGIDYSLFIVTRHREHLAEGLPHGEAAARATATAGGAVVFAGATVSVALCSLALAGIPIVTQMGYLSAAAVLVAMFAAITLLPAALALAGASIGRLRVPGINARGGERSPAWAAWARTVARHPWPVLIAALAAVLLLAAPARTLHLGQSDTGQLPRQTTARQAYEMLSRGFGPGFNGPLLVAVSAPSPSRAALEAVERLNSTLKRTPGVAATGPVLPDRAENAALITVTPSSSPSSAGTEALVRLLRSQVIPPALRGSGVQAYVGGDTAGFIDLSGEISQRLPLVIAVVLCISFLLLLVAFRAPVVALKAVIMNLLSIAAAFGVVTYVFAHDWTARLIGLEGPSPVVSFVPLMMFAILFGLSMDYEVFLMSHVRERHEEDGDAHRAVVEGLAGTARVITSAALIMVAVFCAFLLNGSPAIKQFGLGMAAAVAVDATLIRCGLVPAVLALLGERAWWLPRRLQRLLPSFSIDGEAWFDGGAPAAHEAPAGSRRARPARQAGAPAASSASPSAIDMTGA